MAEPKLTPRQLSQIAVLEVLPPKFEQINRIVEEMAGLRADEAMVRRLCRMLDEAKSATSGLSGRFSSSSCRQRRHAATPMPATRRFRR